jgi:hypothetical protein
MAERILCKNPECQNTIIPITAEETKGFCMPCVQAKARQEYVEYVQQNRIDLNEFEHVTDPVEILKIIHRPRQFDPLITWIPHTTPTDQIYLNLDSSEQYRLAEYAELLIGGERNDEAETIVLCLAAFTNAPIENCLRSFIAHNSFWPSFPFCRASSDIRDELIARVERDEDNHNHILRALAWIGDSVVVELFNQWKKYPPAWRAALHVPPQNYSYEAGWELTDNGQRRNLYFPSCTKLIKGYSSSPQQFQAIAERDDFCPWCSQKLTNLIDFIPSEFGILNVDSSINLSTYPEGDRVQMTTCEVCTAFGNVFGICDESGKGQWSVSNTRPKYLPDDSEDWGRLPQNSLNIGDKRSPLFAADQSLPTTFSQLGGYPAWVQDANYPSCPECSKTMMFLSQIDHNDIEDYSEGIFYAFICPTCRTTSTNYQQT